MGGVIVRTENGAPRTELARRFGMSREELEQVVFDGEMSERATIGEVSMEELWQNICGRLGAPHDHVARLQEGFWGGDSLDTELVEYIRGLRPRYRTALLSNAWSDLRLVLEQRWKIADAFDEIIISAEVGMMKPDPRIFEHVVTRLGVKPGEAVFIDDFSRNVRAAAEAGLHAIRFQSPAQAKEELEAILNGKERSERKQTTED